MQVFDASSMIYAWDNYPIDQFPPLWDWMASQIEAKQLVMSDVAFREVGHKVPDCSEWLKVNKLELLAVSGAILQSAMQIKGSLGIVGDNYHPKGVDENDLLIVATSLVNNATLISDEGKQASAPQILSKRKIPAVCMMPSVSVYCINFIDYIKASGAVFR